MGDKTVKSTKKDGVSRRQVLKGAGVATGAAAVSTIFARPATAAKFPNKPVKLVVPFGTGGGSDRTMRLIAPYLQKYLGVPVNVINVKGAGGWVAWDQQSKWNPDKDDHMLGTVNFPHVMSLLDPRMKRKQTLKSFNFIAWHSLDPCIWAVKDGDKRFQTLEKFLSVAAEKPNGLVMSTTAVGSDDHMGIAYAEKFLPNFKVRKVYANSDGKKIKEVIGGHTDAVGGNIGYYVPYFTDAKLRAICVLGNHRSPNLPNTPTFKEVTGKSNVVFAGRVFSVAPGLSKDKTDVYKNAIRMAMNDPEYQIKELNKKNPLVQREGKELHDAIAASEKFVNSVKYWEGAK
jgi:tripartite-type tricarboxylate transporter receptor subunit TctC